jgi:hypothetical protein
LVSKNTVFIRTSALGIPAWPSHIRSLRAAA